MDKNEAIAKATAFAERVRNKYSIESVILYGSYTADRAREESDIDIAVIFNTPLADMYDISVDLFRLRRGIDNRIEPILLRTSDTESGFLNSIMENGIIIYKNQAA